MADFPSLGDGNRFGFTADGSATRNVNGALGDGNRFGFTADGSATRNVDGMLGNGNRFNGRNGNHPNGGGDHNSQGANSQQASAVAKPEVTPPVLTAETWGAWTSPNIFVNGAPVKKVETLDIAITGKDGTSTLNFDRSDLEKLHYMMKAKVAAEHIKNAGLNPNDPNVPLSAIDRTAIDREAKKLEAKFMHDVVDKADKGDYAKSYKELYAKEVDDYKNNMHAFVKIGSDGRAYPDTEKEEAFKEQLAEYRKAKAAHDADSSKPDPGRAPEKHGRVGNFVPLGYLPNDFREGNLDLKYLTDNLSSPKLSTRIAGGTVTGQAVVHHSGDPDPDAVPMDAQERKAVAKAFGHDESEVGLDKSGNITIQTGSNDKFTTAQFNAIKNELGQSHGFVRGEDANGKSVIFFSRSALLGADGKLDQAKLDRIEKGIHTGVAPDQNRGGNVSADKALELEKALNRYNVKIKASGLSNKDQELSDTEIKKIVEAAKNDPAGMQAEIDRVNNVSFHLTRGEHMPKDNSPEAIARASMVRDQAMDVNLHLHDAADSQKKTDAYHRDNFSGAADRIETIINKVDYDQNAINERIAKLGTMHKGTEGIKNEIQRSKTEIGNLIKEEKNLQNGDKGVMKDPDAIDHPEWKTLGTLSAPTIPNAKAPTPAAGKTTP